MGPNFKDQEPIENYRVDYPIEAQLDRSDLDLPDRTYRQIRELHSALHHQATDLQRREQQLQKLITDFENEKRVWDLRHRGNHSEVEKRLDRLVRRTTQRRDPSQIEDPLSPTSPSPKDNESSEIEADHLRLTDGVEEISIQESATTPPDAVEQSEVPLTPDPQPIGLSDLEIAVRTRSLDFPVFDPGLSTKSSIVSKADQPDSDSPNATGVPNVAPLASDEETKEAGDVDSTYRIDEAQANSQNVESSLRSPHLDWQAESLKLEETAELLREKTEVLSAIFVELDQVVRELSEQQKILDELSSDSEPVDELRTASRRISRRFHQLSKRITHSIPSSHNTNRNFV